jgi:hypothetical protein
MVTIEWGATENNLDQSIEIGAYNQDQSWEEYILNEVFGENEIIYWRYRAVNGLNKPVFTSVLAQEVNVSKAPILNSAASSSITDFSATVGCTIDNGKLETVWSVEYGLTNAYGTNVAGGTINALTTVSKALTGLSQNTLYYWRIKAVNAKGTTYLTGTLTTTFVTWVLPVTGKPSGTATAGIMTISCSEDVTPTVTGSATISVVKSADGSLRKHVITVNCPNNQSGTIVFLDKTKIRKLGNESSGDAFYNGTDATIPNIALNYLPPQITVLRQFTLIASLIGNITNMPLSITYIKWINNVISWAASEFPTALTVLTINGNNFNLTGLQVTGSSNITELALQNYRTAKMSSADMVTLLNSLKDRVGSLPNTFTIGDYVDYASPPQIVTDAVAALKVVKTNVTTITFTA